jgi:hypothetical protein
MTGNDFVTFFLHTPLRVFLGNTMLITVTGCKTGRQYSTPVGFYRDGDTLWVISNRDRTWWRNVQNGANVSLLLNGRTVNAFAETEMNEKTVEKHLFEYILYIPMAAKSFGIRMENKIPNPADIARVAQDRLFIRIKPSLAGNQS